MRRYGWLTLFLVAAVAVTACLSGVVSATQPPIPLYNGATVRGIRPGTYGRGARIPTEYAIKYHNKTAGVCLLQFVRGLPVFSIVRRAELHRALDATLLPAAIR